MPELNYKTEVAEFRARKMDAMPRNRDYFIARQAFRHYYSWPTKWPAYKEKVMLPLVRKSVLTHANLLMGRGFTTSVVPLGSGVSHRTDAQKAERSLFAIISRCNGWRSMWRAAQLGSLLGTSGFKVYRKRVGDRDLAWFSPIQPEFLYPCPAGDDYSELSKVYYAYGIDRLEATRQYGGPPERWKSERQIGLTERGEYVNPDVIAATNPLVLERRIPVLETWTDDSYMLVVGDEVIVNGNNPYHRIPYVVIPNIDSGEGPEGLSDVDALVAIGGQTGLNNHLNWLLSDNYYVLRRLADPTLVWEMAPQNYASIIAGIIGGGGVLPVRMGTKAYYLAYPGQPADMSQMLDRLRGAGVEITGLNETAFSGQSQGSIQTGPSLEIKFTNVLSTLAAKQRQEEVGIQNLFSLLLELGSQEDEIGIVENPYATSRKDRSMKLSGKDIGNHREVKITWPGVLPKDDMAAAEFELSKHAAGVQSKFTTLENLGFDFPDDELERIREEMQDENLRPAENANLVRSQAALMTAQARQTQAEAPEEEAAPEELPAPSDLNELTDTPEGVGTLPDGTVVDDEGTTLDPLSAMLARRRAQAIRERAPLDMGENADEVA